MNWPRDFINKIICGDCLEVMKEMPDESIDMAITSPPYWGLRDYGIEQIFGGNGDCEHDFNLIHRRIGNKSGVHGPSSTIGAKKAQHEARKGEATKTCNKCHAWKGQLGLEPTPEMYIEHLTEIFNEVKRVLKKEGTLWLNIGDTYNAGRSGGWAGGTKGFSRPEIAPNQSGVKVDGLQPKCLCMIPERLAWSLIQNGWILRNKIIWYKPNAMPSSVTDRFSNRWEYIFLFSKSQRYYFDLDAVREPHKESSIQRDRQGYKSSPMKGRYTMPGEKREGTPDQKFNNPDGKNPGDIFEIGAETRTMGAIIGSGGGVKVPGGKGWTAHPKGGGAACLKDPRWCPPEGKNPGDFWDINTQPFPEAHFAVFPEKLCEKPIKAGCPEGGIVLDLFAGAGTALFVAKQLRRRFIGIDIKQEYCEMSEKRVAQGVL